MTLTWKKYNMDNQRFTHSHTHTHTCWFLWFTGTFHRRNGFYTVQDCMCYCPTPTLHLNLALTGDGAFLFSLKKTHSVWFISVLNYGDTENVLINHLLLVIPMSYPCHYTNLCPHKPYKHAPTHTHTHTHTHLLYMNKRNCHWFKHAIHFNVFKLIFFMQLYIADNLTTQQNDLFIYLQWLI